MKSELFIIEPGIWLATDNEEIAATYAGLESMGLARLPYHSVTVRLPAKEILQFQNARYPVDYSLMEADFTLHEYGKDPARPEQSLIKMPTLVIRNRLNGYELDMTDNLTGKFIDPDTGKALEAEAMPTDVLVIIQHKLRAFLIALLATRNIRKVTKVDKLARLGIGKKKERHRYTHVTTISLPRPEDMEDDPDHVPVEGQPKCPHLRRGHVRSQHYGPRNSYVKRIWIDPVFVNADPAFVSKRAAYNLIR